MKFLILNTDYAGFIADDYARHPELKTQSFAHQLSHRYETLFGMADFYSRNLKTLGHEATDLFINHPYLQQQWARERGLKYSPTALHRLPIIGPVLSSHLEQTILEAQIEEYAPDIIYTMCMEHVGSDFFKRLRKRLSFLLIGQHAAPLTPSMRDLSAYDLILSSLPNLVEHFQSRNVRARYFRLGFAGDPVLSTLKPTQFQYNVVFIGSIDKAHSRGRQTLEHVAQVIPDFAVWGQQASELRASSSLRKTLQGEPLYGKEMYQTLLSSKIGINRHIDIAGEFANNMRLYETTGVGTFLITDAKNNLSELFEPGKEVETYQNDKELIEKITYYLSHDEERAAIAAAGQKRTLQDHTYLKRMRELLSIIDEIA